MYKEKPKKYIDKNSAQLKAEAFCAYQERSQYEVRGKLIDLGIFGEDLENIISYLIENNFLNEARFATAYAQGKLRIKGWGKNKIKQGLKLKGVSAPLIKMALQKLNKEEYLGKLEYILTKKSEEFRNKLDLSTKNKIIRYALSRGFEYELIFFALNNNVLKQ